MPNPFETCTNNLEICIWLIEHLYILQLANQMYETRKTSQDIAHVPRYNFNVDNHISIAGLRSFSDFLTNKNSSDNGEEIRIILSFYNSFIIIIIIIIII